MSVYNSAFIQGDPGTEGSAPEVQWTEGGEPWAENSLTYKEASGEGENVKGTRTVSGAAVTDVLMSM